MVKATPRTDPPDPPDSPDSSDPTDSRSVQELGWNGRRVMVGVGGGISCYKAAGLVSLLVQRGAVVRVAMTAAAAKFVTPLTFGSLSGQPVVSSIWQGQDAEDSGHVDLASWTQLLIVAPATADLMARLAAGLADDPVTLIAVALPRQTPVVLAPAMNARMWVNPITQRNLRTLEQTCGYHTVGPGEGWQACRTEGPGRMAEPEGIADAAEGLCGGDRD